jgi:hypothetical protein
MNFLLFQLQDEVNRKKCEYQKYLELYKLMRSRFEEHYVKCKSSQNEFVPRNLV